MSSESVPELPKGLIYIPNLSTVFRTSVGGKPCSIRIIRSTPPKGVAMMSVPGEGPQTVICEGPHKYFFNNTDLGIARALMPASQRSQSITKDFKRMGREIVPHVFPDLTLHICF